MVGLAVVMVAGGAAYLVGAPEAPEAPGDRSPGPGGQTAPRPAAVGDTAAADPATPVPVYVRAADSVAAALDRYRERSELFEQGRLGCGSLGDAYQAVDERFLELAVLYREHRAKLDPTARSRFDDLASRTDGAQRHFDGSRCPGSA